MRKTEGTSILSLHPGAKTGCKLSHNGKCTGCPRYRFVETQHPQTGENIREWDCIDVWKVMFAGDNSRQIIGVHAAIAQNTTEMVKSPERMVTAIEEAQQRRLANAVREN